MRIKKTSFGSMQTLLEKDGEIISELLTFEREGRGHSHELWEHCYIIDGSGVIVNGSAKTTVNKGDTCRIPPNTNHWMIPEPFMEILLVYSKEA